MKQKRTDHRLTPAQLAQLRALEGRLPNTADIPEAPTSHWRHAERGKFFKPRKQAISLRLDMDVLERTSAQARFPSLSVSVLTPTIDAQPSAVIASSTLAGGRPALDE